ncbi:MAG TPA: cupin domain-containing protein, partial [Dongiaceae bacterium]|nr:cupin domain-containing protein [Dongiaceae bacterium]
TMDLALANPDRGQPRWFLGTAIKFLVSAREGNGGLCVVEHHMPHGDAPPLHLHRHEDEIFVVLYGTLRLEVGGHTQFLHAGDAAVAPKGVPHSYVVESDGARVMTITRGHDFESMLRSVSRPANRPGLPPPTAPDADTMARLVEACRQNGIELVGPPLQNR